MSEINVYGWILDEKVLPNQRLKQGDLIRFPDATNPLCQAGLVVTADCDLEQNKHGRLVTLIPIITVKTALEYYLLIEACDKQRESLFNYARKQFGVAGSINEPLVLEELRTAADESTDEKVRLARLAVNIILHRQETVTGDEYRELIGVGAIGGSLEKAIERSASQIKSKGDLVILPSPSALGVAGDIAWVRHIWQEQLGRIAMRTSDVKEGYGERIARLDSPFRYRVTQVMGQVFADIGLPEIERSFDAELSEVLKK